MTCQAHNLLARRWMYRFGASRVIWGGFILAVKIVLVSFMVLFVWMDVCYWHLQFIAGAILVSLFQAVVGHQNYAGRPNCLTRLLARFPLYG